MKTYFSELIPKLKNYSKKLDDVALLTNQHWTIFNEDSNQRIVYIFRSSNELIISRDGNVEKGKWEYLGNNSLLIDQQDNSFLFNHGFLNDKVLALKIDGKNEYAILLNENKIERNISSFNDITRLLKDDYDQKYLNQKGSNYRAKNKAPKSNNQQYLSESAQKIADSDVGSEYQNIAIFILIILGLLVFVLNSLQ